MKNLTEIEYYITSTYRSLEDADPLIGGKPMLHPVRAALTITAGVLAMPTTTTPESVLEALQEEVSRVRTRGKSLNQAYIQSLIVAYQNIMEFITDITERKVDSMPKNTTPEQKERAKNAVKEYAPRGKRIFTHVIMHMNDVALADCYVIVLDEQGEYDSVWLNRYIADLGVGNLNVLEQIITSGTPEAVAQSLAESLGAAVWGDDKAYSFKRL